MEEKKKKKETKSNIIFPHKPTYIYIESLLSLLHLIQHRINLKEKYANRNISSILILIYSSMFLNYKSRV